MHKVRMLFQRQSVVQPYVHEDTCSENSAEHADASVMTIEGMARVLEREKMWCCTSKVLASIGQSKKRRRRPAGDITVIRRRFGTHTRNSPYLRYVASLPALNYQVPLNSASRLAMGPPARATHVNPTRAAAAC